MGIAIDGQTKAYPWWIMDDHHSANDVVAGRPVAIMLCEACSRWDARLPQAALVMGTVARTGKRVYPLDRLSTSGGVVNDDLAGTPIVVNAFQAEGSYGALAFSRVVDGSVLTFRKGPNGPIDGQTGSTWTYEGVAVAGPLTGSRLEFIPSHVSEWYVWAARFPGIEIWSPQDGRPMSEDPIGPLP